MFMLETIAVCHGWEITGRFGTEYEAARRRQKIPRYTVYSPDGRAMEEFRYLRSARAWCRANNDYVPQGDMA
jgi:hypothetical protein